MSALFRLRRRVRIPARFRIAQRVEVRVLEEELWPTRVVLASTQMRGR
jgi:hypothetical protein